MKEPVAREFGVPLDHGAGAARTDDLHALLQVQVALGGIGGVHHHGHAGRVAGVGVGVGFVNALLGERVAAGGQHDGVVGAVGLGDHGHAVAHVGTGVHRQHRLAQRALAVTGHRGVGGGGVHGDRGRHGSGQAGGHQQGAARQAAGGADGEQTGNGLAVAWVHGSFSKGLVGKKGGRASQRRRRARRPAQASSASRGRAGSRGRGSLVALQPPPPWSSGTVTGSGTSEISPLA